MSRSMPLGVLSGLLLVCVMGACVVAATAELYFSYDKNGQQPATSIQEGSQVWFVVYDPDENIDCDVRDKIWTEVKLFDPKTGAHSVWVSYMDENGDAHGRPYDYDVGNNGLPAYTPYRGHFPGNPGWLGADYLEETGANTGLFVSKRPFQIGTRESFDTPRMNTHVVCNTLGSIDGGVDRWLSDFVYGGFIYQDGLRRYIDGQLLRPLPMDGDSEWDDVEEEQFPDARIRGAETDNWLVGRFENMDTLVGIYQDPDDDTDIALAMMKIIDTEASIAWSREILVDANSAATITVVDPDENLDCSQIEYVPVFILVNPGSWNPVDDAFSPTNFCMLKRTGGVNGMTGAFHFQEAPIRWYNIYHSEANAVGFVGAQDGRYYVEYPVAADGNVTAFDTRNANGLTAVSFYAQETSTDSGVFELHLNSILTGLGFNSLNVRDVLVAYYLDPNDFDDFKLATATIGERQHSLTAFTNGERNEQDLYWIGQEATYVQVIDANANVDPCCSEQVVVHICDPHGEDDAEWWILDETSSDSPAFFSRAGMVLLPVWDAIGRGIDPAGTGGFQLQLDNWALEVFNEDDVYARYNDVVYVEGEAGLRDLGDAQWGNGLADGFPPRIDRTRVANDVSFGRMSVGDTQVFDGETTRMGFLDREGNRVSEYLSNDCVFVHVVDPDQDEDPLRRERIDAFWSGGQGGPIGPMALNAWDCGTDRRYVNDWNVLFPDTNILSNAPANGVGRIMDTLTGNQASETAAGWGNLYVANLRNGRWAPVDLLETGLATGEFASTVCIDLADVHACGPTLGAMPGDTIIAVYQDPTNHSDSAWISIKVGIGGGTPSSNQSTTVFVDAEGREVEAYSDTDPVFVKVTDPSHAGAALLVGALAVEGEVLDLAAVEGTDGVFQTEGLELDLVAGDQVTATYTDPRDMTDTSSDSIRIVLGMLKVVRFLATPNPFDVQVAFGYEGTGTASTFHVAVYDLAGKKLWEATSADVAEVVWDGTMTNGDPVANGAYIYTITVSDGSNTFTGSGKVFAAR